MNALSAANTIDRLSVSTLKEQTGIRIPIYVPQLMLLNDGPVTITTMKLKIQLLAVEKAFAGARMRRPTISAG